LKIANNVNQQFFMFILLDQAQFML